VLISFVFIVVDTNNESWSAFIFGGCTHDDFFGSSLKVKTSFFVSKKSTSRFTNNSCTSFTPLDVRGILFSENSNFLSINYDALIPLFNLMVETSMSRIILKLVDKVVDRHEGVINSNNFNRLVILEY